MLNIALIGPNDRLRRLLMQHISRSTALRCVGTCRTAEEALHRLPLGKVHVALVDIRLSGIDGVELTRQLRRKFPSLKILILTTQKHKAGIIKAFRAGANGYLLRNEMTAAQICSQIKAVASGAAPMSAGITRQIVKYLHQLGPAPDSRKVVRLSPREKQVLTGLAQAWTYKAIAVRLGISMNTAHCHLRSLYRKLNVHSRTEAVLKDLHR